MQDNYDYQKLTTALDDAFKPSGLNKQCRVIIDEIEALVEEAESLKDPRAIDRIGQAVRLKFERLAQVVKEASNG